MVMPTTTMSEICDNTFFASTGEKLYLSEHLADIHFVFETDGILVEKVPAHKQFLSGSDVFCAMFNGMWKEKDEAIIADTKPAAFKEFLQFFYFNKVHLTVEHVGGVMALVNMYNVTGGLAICTEFMKRHLNIETICLAYPPAILFEQEKLTRYCDYIVKMNTKEVLSSPSFMECDREVLKHILSLNVLSCEEKDVFEHCMDWVKAKAKVDNLTREHILQYLGELFYDFRFKSMSPCELIDFFGTYNQLFSPEDCKDLFTLAASNISSRFTKKYRTMIGDEEDVLACSLDAVRRWKPHYLRNIESTTFSVNKPIYLKGFLCFRMFSYNGPDQMSDTLTQWGATQFFEPTSDVFTEISIFDRSNGKRIHYEVTCLKHNPNTIVTLDTEIRIEPGIEYNIQMEQELNGRRVCIACQVLCGVKLESNITVKLHNQIDVGEQCPRSMIKELRFKKLRNGAYFYENDREQI